jgi:hypothetical protein
MLMSSAREFVGSQASLAVIGSCGSVSIGSEVMKFRGSGVCALGHICSLWRVRCLLS